jgi:hypothetical protein
MAHLSSLLAQRMLKKSLYGLFQLATPRCLGIQVGIPPSMLRMPRAYPISQGACCLRDDAARPCGALRGYFSTASQAEPPHCRVHYLIHLQHPTQAYHGGRTTRAEQYRHTTHDSLVPRAQAVRRRVNLDLCGPIVCCTALGVSTDDQNRSVTQDKGRLSGALEPREARPTLRTDAVSVACTRKGRTAGAVAPLRATTGSTTKLRLLHRKKRI